MNFALVALVGGFALALMTFLIKYYATPVEIRSKVHRTALGMLLVVGFVAYMWWLVSQLRAFLAADGVPSRAEIGMQVVLIFLFLWTFVWIGQCLVILVNRRREARMQQFYAKLVGSIMRLADIQKEMAIGRNNHQDLNQRITAIGNELWNEAEKVITRGNE